jgi:hypothetical protein
MIDRGIIRYFVIGDCQKSANNDNGIQNI